MGVSLIVGKLLGGLLLMAVPSIIAFKHAKSDEFSKFLIGALFVIYFAGYMLIDNVRHYYFGSTLMFVFLLGILFFYFGIVVHNRYKDKDKPEKRVDPLPQGDDTGTISLAGSQDRTEAKKTDAVQEDMGADDGINISGKRKNNRKIVKPLIGVILVCLTAIIIWQGIMISNLNATGTPNDTSNGDGGNDLIQSMHLVYVRPDSDLYHVSSCWQADKSICERMTPSEAIEAGYEPCPECIGE